LLISVHLPKTAGTSFEGALRSHFGEGLRLDYGAKPLHQSRARRRLQAIEGAIGHGRHGLGESGIACVHGHFLPLSYRWIRCAGPRIFVTWLRDPVERLASHYQHWRRVDRPPDTDLLHVRMLEEDWSFERFALGRELRNIYSEFLWGFPLRSFAFVGISEHYAEDLDDFGRRILGSALAYREERRNPAADAGGYAIDSALRRRIEEFHAADLRLYEKALALREARRSGGAG
jgi:hypothetical protein